MPSVDINSDGGAGLIYVSIISGYLLLTRLHYTSYDIYRLSGYHVIFQSVIAGLLTLPLKLSRLLTPVSYTHLTLPTICSV